MKIKIGPYVKWWGPYQIADLLQYVGVSEDRCFDIGEKMPEWVNKVCYWVDGKRKRKQKIHIDYWDTWNMNDTLALIILPMLKQLKETKHGSGQVDLEDVCRVIANSGALEYARKVAMAEASSARMSIASLPESEFKHSLLELATFAVDRVQ